MGLVDDIAENLKVLSDNCIETTPIKHMFYAKWSSLLGEKGVKFNSVKNAYGEIPTSCYCLNILPSGGSKNVSLNYMDNNLMSFEKDYLVQKNAKLKDLLVNEKMDNYTPRKKDDIDNVRKDFEQEVDNGFKLVNYIPEATPEALYEMCEIIDKLKCGSVTVKNTEFVRYFANSVNDKFSINNKFLDVLYDAYDGVYNARMIKGKQRTEKQGIATNVIFTSSYSQFSDSKINNAFKCRLEDGFARIFLYYYNPKLNYVLNPPQEITVEDLNNAKTNIEKYGEYLKSIFDSIPEAFVYNFTNDAIDVISMWHKMTCKPMAKELYNGSNRELDIDSKILELYLVNAKWLVMKLSVILQSLYLPNTSEIDINVILEAQDIFMESFEQLKNLVCQRGDTVIDRFVDYFIKNCNKDITKTDLRKAQLVNKNDFKGDFTSFYPEIQLELKKEGYYLEFFKGSRNTQIVRCKKSDSIIPYLIGVSVAPLKAMSETPTSFEYSEMEVKDFCKLIKEKTAFVAGELKDGKRKKENYIGNQNTIWLDFDDIKSMEGIKALFEDYSYIAYTSKNHQKEKNGVVGDRFRLILFTNCLLPSDQERYTRIMTNIINKYGTDKACKDSARLYWSNPNAEIDINKGKLFDWRPYDREIEQEVKLQVEQMIKPPFRGGNSFRDILFTDEGDRRLKVDSVVIGHRNNELFRIALRLMHLVLNGTIQHEDAIVKIKQIIGNINNKDFKEFEKRRMIEIVEKLEV